MIFKSTFSKPHISFWAFIPFITLWNILFLEEDIVVNIHDTYFVMWRVHYTILSVLLFTMIGLLYWACSLIGREPSHSLFKIHFWTSLLSLFVIAFCVFFEPESPLDYALRTRLNYLIFGAVILLLIGKAVFLFNIVFTLLRKRT